MTDHPFNLSDRVAVVTGGGSGLGLAIAHGLARAGARVVINGRNRAKLDAAAEQLVGEGLPVSVNAFDVTNEAAVVARAVVPGMKARRRGKIINICSLASDIGRPNIVAYAASKGGLKMMTRALAVELAPHNVQVNGIAPGFFKTEMNTALINNAEFSAWVAKRTPAGRWGDPAEIAGAAVFLSSNAADYVTGHLLYVDGGFSAAY
jgi:gluconate 5-dehydrogenase